MPEPVSRFTTPDPSQKMEENEYSQISPAKASLLKPTISDLRASSA